MITIPSTAANVYTNVWRPAMLELPSRMASDRADVLGLAIGDQESGYRTRDQNDPAHALGPALGFWQMEAGGGVAGVLRHPATADLARTLCSSHGVTPSVPAAWRALATDDVLAAAFARLLLWTDKQPLPAIGDAAGAWAYYLRIWRPGKPDEDRWASAYEAATHAVST